jgi:ABC-type antimicrobial peptide transport system permease subunit
METIQSVIDPEYAPWRLGAAMFGVFGGLALVIAAVGLYSVIAYLILDRTRELGVRIALGASGGRIVREVVLSGMATTAMGIGLGTAAALVAGRFIEPMLFDVTAKNPTVIASVALVVLLIAVVAAWSPARRASRVDPVIALRAD